MLTPLFNTIRSRLLAAILFSFLLVGVFMTGMIIASSNAYQQTITQVMHQDLAAHIAKQYTFFEDEKLHIGQAKHTFHDLMILGPNFEFYILDNTGNILTYSADPSKIVRNTVDLAPIERFFKYEHIEEPLKGTDPRSLDERKIFSVAKIMVNDAQMGFMYVILGGEIYDHTSNIVLDSHILQWVMWIASAGLLFFLMITLWLTGVIIRPLSKLSEQIKHIQKNGFTQDCVIQKTCMQDLAAWKNNSKNEIDQLGHAFYTALLKINKQYQNIVSIDHLRKELLSHVSHDLRTPLASLLGYLETWELMNQETDAAKRKSLKEQTEYINIAIKSAKQISKLIEQLFELAHLDDPNIKLNIETISIAELAQDVVQKFQFKAKTKHITFTVSPQDSNIMISADIEKLERVFNNLISNAIRHSVENGHIDISFKTQNEKVIITIKDTGIGIPEKDLPFIFDPHFKAGNSVRENASHAGLGLAITSKLLELHEECITVESTVNEGTSFYFSLPKAVHLK